jgi:periplasmic mercuric ion binding protein
MKKIFLLSMILLMGVPVTYAQKSEKWATVKIKTSATCGMCKETIETALAYEKGIKKSSLDVKSQVVTVTYNPAKTSLDKIRTAISKSGYDADEVKADPKAYEKLEECCKKGQECEDDKKKH